MKRCLIFSTAYYPKLVGGAEVAIKEITDRIQPADIFFDMVTLRFDSDLPQVEKIGNVTVHRIGWTKKNPSAQELLQFPMYLNKVFYPLLAFFKAFRLHLKYKYDLFWGMMSYAAFPIALL